MKRWYLAVVCLIVGAAAGTLLVEPWLRGAVPAGKSGEVAVAKELTSYRDVVKKVLPAVVSIETRVQPKVKDKKQPKRKSAIPDDPRIPDEFRKFFREFEGRDFEVPDESPQQGFGSGLIVDPQGIVLTNYHVVAGASEVTVQLRDGKKYTSKDIHGDRKTDLAIVRIHDGGKALPYLELGDSDAMEIGDRVLAVGAPFGLTGSVTAGIVSAKGRNGLHMNMYEDFIQTDAAINPGNSGGPLVNLEGKVVGINAAIRTRTGGFQGVGLAVASNLAKTIVKSLEKDGVVRRGYLGVQIKDLSEDVANQLGLPGKDGVIIGRVYPKSPAAAAGLKPGDVVVAINDKPVKEGRMLQTVVTGLPLHKAVPITVVRDGKKQTLQITIEEQPEKFGTFTEGETRSPRGQDETVSLDKIGVQVSELSADMKDELGYDKSAKGVVITQVDEGSAAGRIGLRKGMLIVKIDKKPVANPAAAQEALKNASVKKGILLQVQTPQGGTDYVVLKDVTAEK
jgi:serine protease Do